MNNELNTQQQNYETWLLEQAITGFEVEAMNFGLRQINDAKVRQQYMTKTKALSQQYLHKVQIRELTPQQAADQINALRNEIMDLARLKTSDIKKAKSFRLKQVGKTLEELCEHYAKKLYQRNFTKLTRVQRDGVFREIIKAAGRTRPQVNLRMQHLAKVGRGLFVLSLGIAVYNVATAEDKVRAAGNEGVIIGGGIAGGAAGGAAAGLLCGPGAPVCVTVGVFVGGLLGGVGADMTFDSFL